MNNQTILAVILTIIAIINYGVIIFIWKHPENISGFKWGTKDEEKLEDRKWIGLLVKSLLYANTAMFIGGLVSVFSNSDVLLYTFVCFPIPLAVCYAYCRRKTDDGRSRIKTALIAGTIIALLSVPLLYSQSVMMLWGRFPTACALLHHLRYVEEFRKLGNKADIGNWVVDRIKRKKRMKIILFPYKVVYLQKDYVFLRKTKINGKT